MSVLTCSRCGATTNTVCSEWLGAPEGMAHKCYARFDSEGRWERGCSYNEGGPFDKHCADELCKNELPKSIEEFLEEGD